MPQSLSKMYVHLIFSTKNRERNIFHPEEVYSYIAKTLKALECQPIIVGGDADHIHALFDLCRTRTVCDIVREVKTNSTVWYKQRLGCDFAWQNGYGAFSVSQSKVDIVRKYIAGQVEHHKRHTFKEEYTKFLETYRIAYDERYVWD